MNDKTTSENEHATCGPALSWDDATDAAAQGDADRAVDILRGQLNPDWVEWLMGWVVGWSSLEPLPREAIEEWHQGMASGEWWRAEPEDVPRVATSVPQKTARLRAIGNGQVPATVALAWTVLNETGKQKKT
jgi:hypothetical protein